MDWLNSDGIVHIILAAIGFGMGWVGLILKNAVLDLTNTCTKIDARIAQHEAVCDVRNIDIDRRVEKIEKKVGV